MLDLDKSNHLPTLGELTRRIERLEKETDGFNGRVCGEIDKLKLEVAHLLLGFSAIKWLALAILGSGITVVITHVVEKVTP